VIGKELAKSEVIKEGQGGGGKAGKLSEKMNLKFQSSAPSGRMWVEDD